MDGTPEARGDLQARTTGTVDRSADGYRIELVEFQSHPRFYASALLYLPAHVPPGARLPAVYSPHGHYRTGKHTRSIQIRCANLARRGYAVLIVDTIGHAERAFMGHREPASHALLYAGESLPGLQVRDNIRGLDYLCARPEVDPARIGVTGVSGGGNHTMYLAAVDERVAVAVPVCSVEMLEVYFRKSQCVCETVPDIFTFADKPHLLGLIAPRPLLVMNGLRDSGFATLSSRRAVDHARRIYDLYEPAARRRGRPASPASRPTPSTATTAPCGSAPTPGSTSGSRASPQRRRPPPPGRRTPGWRPRRTTPCASGAPSERGPSRRTPSP